MTKTRYSIWKSKIVFLTVIGFLAFLFLMKRYEKQNGFRVNNQGIEIQENVMREWMGIPPWYVNESRDEQAIESNADGKWKSASMETGVGGRIIWKSPALYYPILGIVLFWIRENWLLREAKKAHDDQTPVEV